MLLYLSVLCVFVLQSPPHITNTPPTNRKARMNKACVCVCAPAHAGACACACVHRRMQVRVCVFQSKHVCYAAFSSTGASVELYSEES